MKAITPHSFYQHQETITLLMSEIRKLGCKKWVKRYCERMHMPKDDVFSLIRGVRK